MSFYVNKSGNSFRLSGNKIELKPLAKLTPIPTKARTAFAQQKPLSKVKKAKETAQYELVYQTPRELSGNGPGIFKKSIDACFVHVYVVLLTNGQTVWRVVKTPDTVYVKSDQFYIDLVTPYLLPLVADQLQHYRLTMRLWQRRYRYGGIVTSDEGWYKIERERQSPQ
jgi:hypothetical protein